MLAALSSQSKVPGQVVRPLIYAPACLHRRHEDDLHDKLEAAGSHHFGVRRFTVLGYSAELAFNG